MLASIYLKPFVKRQKNQAVDAESIVEAAARPTIRFVALATASEAQGDKSVLQQADCTIGHAAAVIAD